MRKAWRALMAAGAVSAAFAMPAVAREFPYCIKGCDFGAGGGDCSFSSLRSVRQPPPGEMRMALRIPIFNAKAEMHTDRSRRSRRRF